MTTLVYDGSFRGWLTAVFEAFEYKFQSSDIKPLLKHQEGLIGSTHHVITEFSKSARVWTGLSERVSRQGLRMIYRAFLSEENGIETCLLEFVRYVFSSKQNVEHDYGNKDVLRIQQVAKKVHREKHRMEAFVRFQLTRDGLYYSVIQPDFNVLPLIEKHFRERYADQRWLIYDLRRHYGIYFDQESVTEVNIHFSERSDSAAESIYDERETEFQELWKQYFSSVNIQSRKNTKLHIQHMPKRYWKYLTEKQV